MERTSFLPCGIGRPSTVAVRTLQVKVIVKFLHQDLCHRLFAEEVRRISRQGLTKTAILRRFFREL